MSRNASTPLEMPSPINQFHDAISGLDLFETIVDGHVAEREHLQGKPAPDTFLAGARALSVPPQAAAVFEDALAGVEAGHRGNFGFVVGVDRVGQADALKAHGADVLHLGPGARRTRTRRRPGERRPDGFGGGSAQRVTDAPRAFDQRCEALEIGGIAGQNVVSPCGGDRDNACVDDVHCARTPAQLANRAGKTEVKRHGLAA